MKTSFNLFVLLWLAGFPTAFAAESAPATQTLQNIVDLNMSEFSKKIESQEILKKTDDNGNTLLHVLLISMKEAGTSIFKYQMKLKPLLNKIKKSNLLNLINAINKQDSTPLDLVYQIDIDDDKSPFSKQVKEIVSLLETHGAERSTKVTLKELNDAVATGEPEKIDKLFLQKYPSKVERKQVRKVFFKKNLNKKPDGGKAPLHYAIASKSIPMINYLLSFKDIDVNIVGLYGNTPLHMAAKMTGGLEIVRLLLDHKRIEINNQAPLKTPLDYATDEEIIKLLKKKGGKKAEDIASPQKGALYPKIGNQEEQGNIPPSQKKSLAQKEEKLRRQAEEAKKARLSGLTTLLEKLNEKLTKLSKGLAKNPSA